MNFVLGSLVQNISCIGTLMAQKVLQNKRSLGTYEYLRGVQSYEICNTAGESCQRNGGGGGNRLIRCCRNW